MIYDITHVTEFDYEERVSVSHHVARLTPRRLRPADAARAHLAFDPAPAVLREHQDIFGNPVAFFAMQGPHRRLSRDVAGRRRRRGAAAAAGALAGVGDGARRRRRPARSTSSISSSTRRWSRPARPTPPTPPRRSRPAAPSSTACVDLTHRLHDDLDVRARGDHRSRRRSPRSSGSAAASARTSPTCRSPACARSACRRAT